MISLDFCLVEKKWREQWFCCLLHFVWIYIYQFVLCGHLMPGLTVTKLRMTRLMSDEGCVEVMQNWIWFEQAFVWNGFSFSVNTNSAITLHNHLYNSLFMNLVVHFHSSNCIHINLLSAIKSDLSLQRYCWQSLIVDGSSNLLIPYWSWITLMKSLVLVKAFWNLLTGVSYSKISLFFSPSLGHGRLFIIIIATCHRVFAFVL